MSKQTFPTWMDQPGSTLHNFRVTGASVGAVAGTAGLDGRGQFLCTISKVTNTVTINWVPAFGDVPYIFVMPSAGQADTLVQPVTNTAGQYVFNTVTASTNAPLNDANLDFLVCSYNTTSYVS